MDSVAKLRKLSKTNDSVFRVVLGRRDLEAIATQIEAERAECAAERDVLLGLVRELVESHRAIQDWQHRVAHDERVCGWIHGQDYGLYCLLADPDAFVSDDLLARAEAATKDGAS